MRIRSVLAICFALLLVAAACGDDSGSTDASDDAEVSETDAEGSEEPTDEGSGDESDDASTDDEMDDETSDDSGSDSDIDAGALGGALSQICGGEVIGALAAFAGAFDPFASGDVSDGADVFDALAAEGPDELQDDFAVLGDAVREITSAYEGIDLSDPAALSDPEALAQIQQAFESIDFDEDAVEEASNNIEMWFNDNCDVG